MFSFVNLIFLLLATIFKSKYLTINGSDDNLDNSPSSKVSETDTPNSKKIESGSATIFFADGKNNDISNLNKSSDSYNISTGAKVQPLTDEADVAGEGEQAPSERDSESNMTGEQPRTDIGEIGTTTATPPSPVPASSSVLACAEQGPAGHAPASQSRNTEEQGAAGHTPASQSTNRESATTRERIQEQAGSEEVREFEFVEETFSYTTSVEEEEVESAETEKKTLPSSILSKKNPESLPGQDSELDENLPEKQVSFKEPVAEEIPYFKIDEGKKLGTLASIKQSTDETPDTLRRDTDGKYLKHPLQENTEEDDILDENLRQAERNRNLNRHIPENDSPLTPTEVLNTPEETNASQPSEKNDPLSQPDKFQHLIRRMGAMEKIENPSEPSGPSSTTVPGESAGQERQKRVRSEFAEDFYGHPVDEKTKLTDISYGPALVSDNTGSGSRSSTAGPSTSISTTLPSENEPETTNLKRPLPENIDTEESEKKKGKRRRLD